MEDLVSVIVPVYNVEKYLDACVCSIVNQTYRHLEIILVDDGSFDLSPQICDKWKLTDSRVQVIHKQNEGLSEARNIGIQAANGSWLIFVDSDDVVSCRLVMDCYKIAKKYLTDMVVFDYIRVSEDFIADLGENTENKKNVTLELMTGKELLRECLRTGKGGVMACNKFYRAALWKTLKYPVGRLHEDEYVIAELLYRVKDAMLINSILYYYRDRPGSITNARTEKSIEDMLEAMALRCEFLKFDHEMMEISNYAYLWQIIRKYSIEKDKQKRRKLHQIFISRFRIHICLLRYWKGLVLCMLFCILPKLCCRVLK